MVEAVILSQCLEMGYSRIPVGFPARPIPARLTLAERGSEPKRDPGGDLWNRGNRSSPVHASRPLRFWCVLSPSSVYYPRGRVVVSPTFNKEVAS